MGDSTANVSIDVGDLTTPSVGAKLHIGDVLFIGSNGCGSYVIPESKSVGPVLKELSRHQQASPGPGDGSHTLEVRYQGVAPGAEVVQISCRSTYCSGISEFGSSVHVNVTVVDAAG